MSSNYFKTLESIKADFSCLLERLTECEKYWAHLHSHKAPEKLVDHTRLVGDYAFKLIQSHHLEIVIERLIQALIQKEFVLEKKAVGSFIKSLFWQTILFHDYGKINENFQRERMQNPHFSKKCKNKIGSRHSALSAFILISVKIQELRENSILSQNEKDFITLLIVPFAGVILKHHASYYDHDLDIPPDWIEAMKSYLSLLHIRTDFKLVKNLMQSFQDEQRFLPIVDFLFKDISAFSLFGLIRLCYSLLTAADYYATTEYTIDLAVKDFGVFLVGEKEKLQNTFKTSKSYNKDFYKRQEYYLSLPLDKLQKRNPENLNTLRQKLMAETLNAVKQNKNEYVFYLEAPTGSGKTNLSLAIAMELLQAHQYVNKILYVFPFTTLITQTAQSIKETLQVTNAQMVQLHSRSGFHSKREEVKDGQYGQQYQNYIDNLFVNYPIILMTHIKFFDILKSTQKENIYLLHRLANSIVIIDELQSYSPAEWDKIRFFISNFAYFFNIRFILMSATLPKLDALFLPESNQVPLPHNFISLLKNPKQYFQNPNFKGRVQFDFSLIDKITSIEELADFVFDECEKYSFQNNGVVKGIIEFIFKKRAGEFYKLIKERFNSANYQIYLLSGTILEPRRKEIIAHIKKSIEKKSSAKILLITTQVVEAGVDIDMDIGFKDRSLIDSDEQLAGRVNRNARTIPAKVFLFKLDRAYAIYGKDLRYALTRDHISQEQYQKILQEKRFEILYQQVCDYINRENKNEFIRGLKSYLEHFKKLRFSKIDRELQLISEQNVTVFVPLKISTCYFSNNDLEFISTLSGVTINDSLEGELVWKTYINIIKNKDMGFVEKRVDIKKIYGIMSQFMFSIYVNSGLLTELKNFADLEIFNSYQILYLSRWEQVYSYTDGIKDENFKEAMFI